MNKKLLQICIMTIAISSCTEVKNSQSNAMPYRKSDLRKIKWIEGSWKGMHNNKPFYEIYRIINDSTLRITSYNWNGTDSTNTEHSYVYWNDGAYYLGEKMNWKVVSINKKEIVMKRNNKTSNDILWRQNDNNSWDAILETSKDTVHYLMKRFDPFKK